jgi:hypothetical protein
MPHGPWQRLPGVDNVGEVMADNASFPDDISALWVDPEDGALEPPRWNATAKDGNGHAPASTGGSHAEAPDPATMQALETITQVLRAVQTDVSRLHGAIDELREEMAVLRRRSERVRGLRAGTFPLLGHAQTAREHP